MTGKSIYAELAVLFSYPKWNVHEQANKCMLALQDAPRVAVEEFRKFHSEIASLSCPELQELFTRTFDLNPLCTLEIGWQLYGEDYGRGEFLVKMRQHLRNCGIPESGELPDHLSHALTLLAKLPEEEAAEFASVYLLSAIDKMRNAWKENRNGYAHLLEATFALLSTQFPYDPSRTPAPIPELRVLQ